jgi:amino-acid N-acetyltransferase
MTQRRIALRTADAGEAVQIHDLIAANQQEGHLLPRTLEELRSHAERFVVAVRGEKLIGCAELAALSAEVAEVRSLAVDAGERRSGVGLRMVEELRRRAHRERFQKLCAFTHVPGYFTRMGFSIVPHAWLLEKVFTDCLTCALFRRCGQYAMVLPLDAVAAPAKRTRIRQRRTTRIDRRREPRTDRGVPVPAAAGLFSAG